MCKFGDGELSGERQLARLSKCSSRWGVWIEGDGGGREGAGVVEALKGGSARRKLQ